jgi:1-phosphatidylinositol-3-phosphate 5-kinase
MLRGALWNDTNFLQNVNVMDYSLLVGVDDQSNELVLGIVGKQAVQLRLHGLMRQ